MATALAATFQAGTTTDPPRCLLQVTGAPAPTYPYTGAFSTTDDSWTATGTGQVFNVTEGSSTATGFLLRSGAGAVTFSRTVTGLTIGNVYTFALIATRTSTATSAPTISVGVSGIGATSALAGATGVALPLSYQFTATATSHVVQVYSSSAVVPVIPLYQLSGMFVRRDTSWLGTTITRTDSNGTSVVVREAPGGQDTAGTAGSATMTVTDYEGALIPGSVSYTVTDGAGATAVAAATVPATPGAWLTLPATSNPATPTPPRFVQVTTVTAYTAAAATNGSLHRIIGRADPIVNPGPLLLRTGTLDVYCATFADAQAVRALLANGDVAQLRQPTFPGVDMYLAATNVALNPSAAQPVWVATVTYQEVLAP